MSTICDYIYDRFMPAESQQFDISSGSAWKLEHGHIHLSDKYKEIFRTMVVGINECKVL